MTNARVIREAALRDQSWRPLGPTNERSRPRLLRDAGDCELLCQVRRVPLPQKDHVKGGEELVIRSLVVERQVAVAIVPVVTQLRTDAQVRGRLVVQTGRDLVEVAGAAA